MYLPLYILQISPRAQVERSHRIQDFTTVQLMLSAFLKWIGWGLRYILYARQRTTYITCTLHGNDSKLHLKRLPLGDGQDIDVFRELYICMCVLNPIWSNCSEYEKIWKKYYYIVYIFFWGGGQWKMTPLSTN